MPVKITQNGKTIYSDDDDIFTAMDVLNDMFPERSWPRAGKDYEVVITSVEPMI